MEFLKERVVADRHDVNELLFLVGSRQRLGVVAKYFLNLLLCRQAVATSEDESVSMGGYMLDFFRNPVVARTLDNGELHLFVDKPLVCFNAMKLEQELSDLPAFTKTVCVYLDSRVALIDHSSCETLHHLVESSAHSAVPITVVGLERMLRLSKHASSVHISGPIPAPQPA